MFFMGGPSDCSLKARGTTSTLASQISDQVGKVWRSRAFAVWETLQIGPQKLKHRIAPLGPQLAVGLLLYILLYKIKNFLFQASLILLRGVCPGVKEQIVQINAGACNGREIPDSGRTYFFFVLTLRHALDASSIGKLGLI